MTIIKAYKMRIYPSEQQAERINKTLGCCRYVYNQMLDRNRKAHKRRGEHLSYNEMQNLVPKMKKYLPWLREADSQALNYACRQLDNAYKKFFKKQTGFPRFKRKHDREQSYTTTQSKTIHYTPGMATIPCLGQIKCSDKRTLPEGAKICTATVSSKNGKYYVSISFKYDKVVIPVAIDESKVIGLDYKSNGLYCDNEGHTADMPHHYRKAQKKLKKEQQRLSRKQGSRKGEKKSNRWKKQCLKVNKIHEHIANQRKDFLHKESTRLADHYDAVIIEDVDMRDILQTHDYRNYHKATYDNGNGMFRSFLEYKLTERGKQFIKVPRSYPSTQLCSVCGSQTGPTDDSVRKWVCPVCGTTHDRDVNAATNIRREGLNILSA